jgi:hypothetical protein
LIQLGKNNTLTTKQIAGKLYNRGCFIAGAYKAYNTPIQNKMTTSMRKNNSPKMRKGIITKSRENLLFVISSTTTNTMKISRIKYVGGFMGGLFKANIPSKKNV